MNFTNYIKTLDEKLSSQNKANFGIENKCSSDNALPYIFCNKFNKSLITGINTPSEASTKYSFSGVKEKNLKIKRRIGISLSEKINPQCIDIVFENKIKAFEALENLLENDNDNIEEERTSEEENKNENEKNKPKRKKILSVPKLDFSEIVKHYKKKPLYIQEVKYISDSSENSEDEDIDYNNNYNFYNDKEIKNEKSNALHHHYHHLHHHHIHYKN